MISSLNALFTLLPGIHLFPALWWRLIEFPLCGFVNYMDGLISPGETSLHLIHRFTRTYGDMPGRNVKAYCYT